VRGDANYLRMAARLAWRGAGRASPNPMVGCVIVSAGGEVIGAGHHRAFGGAHAEAAALASCARRGVDVRGATVYVTLEPCAHEGKTPACAGALARARVGEVVAAARDAGEAARGGFDALEAAGVRGRVAREAPAVRVGGGHLSHADSGLPFVTCKWAQTVDGCVAGRGGESKWISGQRSRRLVHRLRGRADAVIVGAGTVHADDPLLTARGVRVRRRAVRAVFDSSCSLAAESKLARSVDAGPVVVVCARGAAEGVSASALRGLGVEVVGVEEKDGRVCVRAGLRALADRFEVREALCEAGPALTGALVREGLAGELLVFTGPVVLGDPGARAAVDVGARSLDEGRGWRLATARRVDDDVMSVYWPERWPFESEAGESAGSS